MNRDILEKLTGQPAATAPLPLTARYPEAQLRTEIIKSALGCLLSLGAIVALRPSPLLGWPIALVALLFGLYCLQMVRRRPLRYQIAAEGLRVLPPEGAPLLPWSTMENMRLHFYPNSRKGGKGTLNLQLFWEGRRYKVDSGLDHFPTLLAEAARTARERGLELHPTTQDNLVKLEL